METSENLGVLVGKALPQGLMSRVTMDLAAGFGLLGCIVGFSLIVPSGFVGMLEACLDVRSDALILDQLGLVQL